MAVARKHQLDSAAEDVIASLGDERISAIDGYGDFAEWQYDFTNGKWQFRALRGWFPESLKEAGDFSPLTATGIMATMRC